MNRLSIRPLLARLAVAAAIIVAAPVEAQVVAPSLFTTSIHVQGEAAGTEFDDWTAAGVVVVDADPLDNPGSLDIANVQVANDDNFVYIRASLHNAETLSLANLFLAFDTDQDITTGFDIFQIGELGSELGYQTDFPFAQHASAFNLNLSLTGGPLGNGGALIYPFWTEAGAPAGVGMEWAVPLDGVIQFPPTLGGPAPSIPNPSFNFVVYTTEGLGDISSVISYTLAEGPAGTPGDFDKDQDVDGGDFLVWQQGFGAPFNADDLADWQTSFGAGPSIASVPEPASLSIVAVGVWGLYLGALRTAPRKP
ncbi:MAG: hypothetical protein IT424_04555 [Pirellulales bacterium]|nr:hypothetical protein [Pirellulales bacterium]